MFGAIVAALVICAIIAAGRNASRVAKRDAEAAALRLREDEANDTVNRMARDIANGHGVSSDGATLEELALLTNDEITAAVTEYVARIPAAALPDVPDLSDNLVQAVRFLRDRALTKYLQLIG